MLIQEPCNRFGLVLVISSSVEQYLRFAKRVKDLWSLIILRIWYLGRSINRLLQQSSLEEISNSTICLRTDCEIYLSSFYRTHKYESVFLAGTIHVYLVLDFCMERHQAVFIRLHFPLWCYCSKSWIVHLWASLCRVCVLIIDFGLLALNTRLFLRGYFASELISLQIL